MADRAQRGTHPEAPHPVAQPVAWVADAVALLALVALWSWCFRSVIAGRGLVFDGEIHEILLPLHHFLREQVVDHGRLPLWNPHLFFGYPWLGAIQAGPLYPPSWLADLALPVADALTWNVALHFLLAGVAMYAFARAGLGVRPAAAVAAAAIYAFNGHMVGNLGQLHNHATLAWVPLVLLAIRRLAQSESGHAARRTVGLGALALGLSWLGGMAQQALYVGVLEGCYALVLLGEKARASRGPGAWADPAARLLAMAALASAMFAPQALATSALLAESARGSVTAHESLAVAAGSLSSADLVGLFFPNLVGWGALGALNTVFVGGIPLALAFAWAWRSIRHGDLHERAFAVTLVCALAFAAGEHDPVMRVLYRLPLVGLFHDPVRAVSVALLAIAVLAARAIDAAGRDRVPARSVVLAGLLVAAGIVGGIRLAFWAGWIALPDSFGEGYASEIAAPTRGTLQIATLAALLVALLVVARAATSRRVRAAAPALLAAGTLVMLGWLAAPFARTESRAKVEEFVRGPAVLAHVPRALGEAGYPRLANLDRDDVAVEPFESEFRWASPSGFSSLVPREVLEFTGAGRAAAPLRLTGFLDFTHVPLLLDLSASRFLLARRPFLDRGAPLASGGGYFVYANESALPRAYRTSLACRPEPRTALETLLAGTLDPRVVTVLDSGAPLDLAECDDARALAPQPGAGWEPAARFLVDEPDRLVVDVSETGDERPWLVILDRSAPGWSASADGVSIPLFRANALFRAVRVPPGTQVVELRYAPTGQWALLVLALGALGAALMLALAPRSRTRDRAA
ncbi:MAG: hypothetical protein U0610_04965 [bacterium]